MSDTSIRDEASSEHSRDLVTMAMFTGMAILSNVELFALIPLRFKRRSGVYFYSTLVATFGGFLYNIYLILYYFVLVDLSPYSYIFTGTLGYLLYIPAQNLMLYSRLHLLSTSKRLTRIVIVVAIAQFILVTLPDAASWIWWLKEQSSEASRVSSIVAIVEASTYTAVEISMSCLYIFQAYKLWNSREDRAGQKVLKHLIGFNGLLILMYIANLTMRATSEGGGLADTWVVSSHIFRYDRNMEY
jgi:hypothetical protein